MTRKEQLQLYASQLSGCDLLFVYKDGLKRVFRVDYPNVVFVNTATFALTNMAVDGPSRFERLKLSYETIEKLCRQGHVTLLIGTLSIMPKPLTQSMVNDWWNALDGFAKERLSDKHPHDHRLNFSGVWDNWWYNSLNQAGRYAVFISQSL